LFRGGHQRPQPGARNVFNLRKIDDDISGPGTDRNQQSVLKTGARQVVNAANRLQHQHAVPSRFADFQGPASFAQRKRAVS
jgi:hypothetical protein